MKSLLLLLLVAICAADKRQAPGYPIVNTPNCISDDKVFREFHLAYDAFIVNLYQTLALREKTSYTTSPQSVWITLAAIAEGADYFTQKELFALLNLPNDSCTRQKFYQIATTRIPTARYIRHNRALVIDDNARINPNWYGLVQQSGLIDVIPAPIRFNQPSATNIINKVLTPKTQKLDFSGSSVLLNTFDYNGIWNTAFSDAILERAPFYNATGAKTGYVDLMRVIRKVRIGFVKSANLKVMELPIGLNKEYSIIFALTDDYDTTASVQGLSNTIVLDILDALKESPVPVDIAIPRLSISTELDMKEVLKDMGILSTLWTTPGATRFISTPAARPSTYIEKTSITLNPQGLTRPPFEYPVYRHASKDDLNASEFVADRPFLFGLFDTETYTNLMSNMFSSPTYPLEEESPVKAESNADQ